MPVLKITAKGQVSLNKTVLKHLGVGPGDSIDAELRPDGRVSITPARTGGSVEDFIGCLAGKSEARLSLAEIDEAIKNGWAGKR